MSKIGYLAAWVVQDKVLIGQDRVKKTGVRKILLYGMKRVSLINPF